jgi:hypothetical protein
VGSIARIPDPIKRSVYLRECSALMQVQEDLLHGEANKVIGASLKKREEKAAREPNAASDLPPMPPPMDGDPFFPTDPGAYFPPSEAGEMPPWEDAPSPKGPSGSAYQERDIVRLLILFGSQMLPEDKVTLGEYVLADLQESLGDFDNPLYGKIASECHALLLEGKHFDQHYFIQHPQSEVANLAIEVLAEPWEYSPNWEAVWNYPLQNQPMPEQNFTLDMRQSLDRFKLRKVQKNVRAQPRARSRSVPVGRARCHAPLHEDPAKAERNPQRDRQAAGDGGVGLKWGFVRSCPLPHKCPLPPPKKNASPAQPGRHPHS